MNINLAIESSRLNRMKQLMVILSSPLLVEEVEIKLNRLFHQEMKLLRFQVYSFSNGESDEGSYKILTLVITN